MINELDEALGHVLEKELGAAAPRIEFRHPNRDFEGRFSEPPTIDIFLYDVRENLKLRHTATGWELERGDDGKVTPRRRPIRVDLHYLITTWATDPFVEHYWLSQTLMALFRMPELPTGYLPPDIQQVQLSPISVKVAQYDTGTNLSDLWSAMGSEPRPAIVCVVTVSLNPYTEQPAEPVPLVRKPEFRLGQVARPWIDRIGERFLFGADLGFEAGLQSNKLPDGLRRQFEQNGVSLSADVRIRPDGTRGGKWHIDDAGSAKTYAVQRETTVLSVLEELAAYWTVGGRLYTDQPLEKLHLSLKPKPTPPAMFPGEPPSGIFLVPTPWGGIFTASHVRAGQYTLEIVVDGGGPCRLEIEVPAPDYDIDFDGRAIRGR